MANPHRGEVQLGGPDGPLTLRFSINALCDLEEASEQPIQEVLKAFDNPEGVSLRLSRTLLWAALRDHHPETTLERAGDILDAVGVATAFAAIARALSLAFPRAKKKTAPSPSNP